MSNPSDDAELWHCDAPYGCGLLRTVGGMVVGGAPIFVKLQGHMVTLLPRSYKLTQIGTERFVSGEHSRRWVA